MNLFNSLGGSSRGGTRISPAMLAVLGELASRTLKGKGRLADLLRTGPAATAGSPKSSGLGGVELSGGLADLLARFRQAKQEKTARAGCLQVPTGPLPRMSSNRPWGKSAFSGSSSKRERLKMNSWLA